MRVVVAHGVLLGSDCSCGPARHKGSRWLGPECAVLSINSVTVGMTKRVDARDRHVLYCHSPVTLSLLA